MLEIIEFGKDEYAFPSLIVLGCFDAIHQGHRELFKKAKLQAKINGLDLGVMMFRDGKGGKTLYSFEERVKMLEKYNVKFVLAIDFTPEFKDIAPLDFLAAIEDKINVKAYMSGKDFRFGKGAKGKSSTLKNFAEDEENGVWYMPLKDVLYDGEKISTTLVKSCLDSGDVTRANALLGEPFYLDGQVVEGAHRGTHILGFPTVNIVYPEWKYPVRKGVYKVLVTIDDQQYSAIANYGTCPTFEDKREVLEAHIKDFSDDLYGKEIRVCFICFMRGIKKFTSPDELAAQLSEDKAALDLSDEEFAARYGQAYLLPDEECVNCADEPVEEAKPDDTEKVSEEVKTEEVGQAEVSETDVQAQEAESGTTTEEQVQPATEQTEEVVEEQAEPAEEQSEPVKEQAEEPADDQSESVTEQTEEVSDGQSTEQILENGEESETNASCVSECAAAEDDTTSVVETVVEQEENKVTE